jgi:septum formation protein
MRLILASASPRRAELLRAAGYTFDIVVAVVDESIGPGESPAAYVRRLAADKSAAVLAALKGRATPIAGRATPAEYTALKDCATPTEDNATRAAEDISAPLVILGADTTVVVNGEILGKPRDDEEGRDMLRRLSGRTHEVLTGVSLRQGAYEVGRVEITSVIFRALTGEEIDWYVASGEGRDKAGGYAIQGLASRFILRIDGSYSNVVGLPVACVAELLPEIRHGSVQAQ